MYRELKHTGIAALAALLFCAGFARIPFTQAYSEFIVGELAYYQWSKTNDLLILPLAVLVFVTVYFVCGRLFPAARPGMGESAPREPGVWQKARRLLPGGAAAFLEESGRFLADERVLPWHILLGFFLGTLASWGKCNIYGLIFGAALFCLGAEYVYRRKIGLAQSPESLNPALAGAVLLALLPVGLMLALTRLFPSPDPLLPFVSLPKLQAACMLVGLSGVLVTHTLAGGYAQSFSRRVILLGQAGLPLLYLAFIPAGLLLDGEAFSYRYSSLLRVCVIIAALAAWVDIFRRFFRRGPASWGALFSPVALFAVIALLLYGNTALPILPDDDYHFGEQLYGFAAYFGQGILPYAGYSPPHGPMLDDLPNILCHVLYDGMAGSMQEAARLASVLQLGIAFAALQFFGRRPVLSLFLAGLGCYTELFLPLIPLFAILLWQPEETDYGKWLLAWALLAAYTVFVIPPQGILAACATGLPAFVYFCRCLKKGRAGLTALLPALFVLLFLLASPLRDVYWGIARYVLENGAANQTAWGFPWQLAWADLPAQCVRVSWVLAPALAGVMAVKSLASPERGLPLPLPALACALFSLLLIPYSMGRMDLGNHSRVFLFSYFCWTTLLPIMLFGRLRKNLYWLLLAVSGFYALSFSPPHLTWKQYDAYAYKEYGRLAYQDWRQFNAYKYGVIPSDLPVTDCAGLGIRNVGKAVVTAPHLRFLSDAMGALDEAMPYGGVFYNASNFSTLYSYAGRPLPTEFFAPLNAPTRAQQARIIRALEAKQPEIALLGIPGRPFLWPLAWRSHDLYRYLLEHYTPFEQNGLILGRLKKDAAAPGREETALFSRAFAGEDLGRIPGSWGASEKSLAGQMREVLAIPEKPDTLRDAVADTGFYRAIGPAPALVYDLSRRSLRGNEAGLLRLRLSTAEGKTPLRFRLRWVPETAGGFSEENSLVFEAIDGVQIIPLDAFPAWLRGGAISAFSLEPESPGALFKVTELRFMQRL